MKFMLLMNAPRGTGDWDVATWAHDDLKAHIGFMQEVHDSLTKDGVLVAAEGLTAPSQARLVRAGKDGAPITDGPFPETKEFLAGFWIVDVESAEQAYTIAARISQAPGKGGAPMYMGVEVRQVGEAPEV